VAASMGRDSDRHRHPLAMGMHLSRRADLVGAGQTRVCWDTKLSTISLLTGATLSSRVMPHIVARPYSVAIPLPPWVWIA